MIDLRITDAQGRLIQSLIDLGTSKLRHALDRRDWPHEVTDPEARAELHDRLADLADLEESITRHMLQPGDESPLPRVRPPTHSRHQSQKPGDTSMKTADYAATETNDG